MFDQSNKHSSIAPDFCQSGFLAGKLLIGLLAKPRTRKQEATHFFYEVREFIERESSQMLPPATRLVEPAKKFIRENACSGIKVKHPTGS